MEIQTQEVEMTDCSSQWAMTVWFVTEEPRNEYQFVVVCLAVSLFNLDT